MKLTITPTEDKTYVTVSVESLHDAKARLDKTRGNKPSSERAPDAAGFGFLG